MYDTFGNRIKKESREHQTSYRYNSLNQLINLTDQSQEGTSRETYLYDKRGNLTETRKNGALIHQYIYGTLNRLEKTVNAAGETAKYQYHGLGHRVGKQEAENQEPMKHISYLIDLTKEYHNLLEKTEDTNIQTYFWDGNIALYEENGRRNYYLQDDLGSPIRIEGENGILRETYGYGAFGDDLYGIQERIQPFEINRHSYFDVLLINRIIYERRDLNDKSTKFNRCERLGIFRHDSKLSII